MPENVAVPGRPLAISPAAADVAAGAARQFIVSPPVSVSWSVVEAVPAPTYPLRVSGTGRYLVDASGRPWRVQADSAWFMSTNATPPEVDAYLAIRKAQGFNAFYLMAMVHPGEYSRVPRAPANYRGDPPFARIGDFSTPGEAYWRWIDLIVDKAAAQGMVVMLAYTYLGFRGGAQGWYQEVLRQPSREALYQWGLWLGNRYKDRANLIWFALGDYHPPAGSEGSIRVRRIIDGIKAAGATQLFMAEASPPDTLPAEVPDFANAIDMNSFYGYGARDDRCVYRTADRAWAFSPPKPAWLQEGIYEFAEANWETRRARYWSVLAGGIAGDGFGSSAAFQWVKFPASLSTPGAEHSAIAFRLFASLPWWDLRPSGRGAGYAGRDLVSSGGGTWGGVDYVTAAATPGGTHLLAYLPPTGTGARSISVDMAAMNGPARARWFNPTTGAYVHIASALPNTGTRWLTTPGDNGTATNDWVLVLEVPGPDRCGTITPSGLYTAPAAAPAGATCLVTAIPRAAPAMVARAAVNLH